MDKSLAERIVAARKKLGWTQKEAAAHWRVNRRTLESWEYGRYEPILIFRQKLERILSRIEKDM